MKKITIINKLIRTVFFTILLFTTIHVGYSQTLTGDLLIDTQAQLDALPTYTEVTGKLRVRGADINDLSKLGTIQTVGGNVEILDQNDILTSLSGLGNLTTVSGNLWIRNNAALTDISALSSLSEVTGSLYLYGNAVIATLDGLEFLDTVANMYIGDRDGDPTDGEGNPSLTDLCALQEAANYSGLGDFFIAENGFNPTSSDIAAGINCSFVVNTYVGNLTMTTQAQIDALDTYTHIDGKLVINGADITDLSKFGSLIEVKGLEVRDTNTILTSLNGFNNLGTVIGNFWIRRNAELIDISALSSLTEITGDLVLYENPKLPTLDGLNGLAIVANMYIGDRDGDPTDGEGNPLLTDLCALQAAASYASLGDFFIAENGHNPTQQNIIDGVNCSSTSETYVGNLTISSQADLDAIVLSYTHIDGKLVINGADVTDLSKFISLIETKGLEIRDGNTILASLNGLGNLARVEGNFWLRRNAELIDISALSSLTEITGDLVLYENPKLPTLNGLDNLAIVSNMYIGDRDGDPTDGEGNPLLTNLCSLQLAANYSSLGNFFIAENAHNPTPAEVASGTNCSTLSVDSLFAKEIIVYPNPTTGILRISDTKNQEYKVTVFNVIGKIVINSATISNQKSIDISNLERGVYFMNINLGDKNAVKKIVKN